MWINVNNENKEIKTYVLLWIDSIANSSSILWNILFFWININDISIIAR